MRTNYISGILKAQLFITILLLITLWGCGSGGGSSGSGGSGSGSSTLGYSESNGNSDGSKPGSGLSTDNSITLSWDRPTLNSDGSNLNDLAGFKIHYGTFSKTYTQSIDVGNLTSAVVSSLSSGTWCFATTAYDVTGNESDYSNEVCKTI